MPEIYQIFDLDLEAMTKLGHERLGELDLPQAGKTLRQDLTKKGYIVLESNKIFNGVPESVIVGWELGMKDPGYFYELAERLGVQYESGIFYIKRNGTD